MFQWNQISNHGKNICRIFHIIAQFEKELDYNPQKMNIQNSSYVVEWTKNLGSWEIREFHGNLWKAWYWWASVHPTTKKTNFDSCTIKLPKVSNKAFHRKTCVTLFRGFAYTFLSKVVWVNIFSSLILPRPHGFTFFIHFNSSKESFAFQFHI